MKQLPLTVIVGAVSFGTLLFCFNRFGDNGDPIDSPLNLLSWDSHAVVEPGPPHRLLGPLLRAPGKIEGTTETIELRTRISEQIVVVHVTKGIQVSRGDLLVSLDSVQLIQKRDLAKAQFEIAIAKKERLENGPRSSEIEAAHQDYEASVSPLWSAERALTRGIKLFNSNAISQQSLDELNANVNAIRAIAAASKARLTTIKLPARTDEMAAANAEMRAAESRLMIAQTNLERTQLRAPIDGRILDVKAKIGELTGPDSLEPMIIMVDTSQLHAIAEVDEFDALRVELGQRCEITSDASDGILAVGQIVEIEPQMQPKRMFGQWAGERNDTFSRRVKIALEDRADLPIGLPIEVAIKANPRDTAISR